MKELIDVLKDYAACYKDDPEGFAEDFALTVGFTVQELTDRLDDEITELKSYD